MISHSPFRRLRRLAIPVAALVTAVLVGCTEQDVGSQACPALCPNQNVVVKDTSFDVVLTDTTLTGFQTFGIEQSLVLASVGGNATLDIRAVIRFDSLQTAYLPPGFTADSAPVGITHPDSAHLFLHVDTLNSRVPATFTINVYDVDTTSVDSLTQLLVPLFRASRLIGSRTFTTPEWLDTVSIPIDTAKLRVIVGTTGRLRVGMQVVPPPGADAFVRIASTETTVAPNFFYKAAPDSGAAQVRLVPRSNTPALFSTAQASFADFTIPVVGTPPLAPNTLGVGGLPAKRTVVTFALPTFIVDSSQVIRAILTLTQLPRRGYRDTDTAQLIPLTYVASTNVTDPLRATAFAQPLLGAIRARYSAGAWTDSLKLLPKDSGQRQVEITAMVREWGLNPTAERRILAFRVLDEGFTQADLRFFSSAAAPSLRPRVRVLYIPAPPKVTP
ncbi:MAG: hypothetical protein HY275_16920 [Gemmatimonadetes bacterium]|nr:hypothetical protein [Gemmatimonadota bacterium]